MAASAARLLLPYLALAVAVFILARFVDGDSLGSSIVQASISTLVTAAVWEFIVYVRRPDDL
jgi:hypothetical protein